MKNITLILFFVLFSMAAKAEDFRCNVYSLDDENPMQNAIELDFYVDTYKNEALVTGPEDMEDQGKAQVVNGTDKLFKLTFGRGPSTMEFFINTDPSIDIQSEYVNEMAQRHGLSQAQVQQMKRRLSEMFGNVEINGTQTILAQVRGFLNCQKL